MTTKRHLTLRKNLLAMIKKQLILMRKQLKMIFEQTFTKIIVTKKHLLILAIIIPFYKLMLTIMKLLQKIHRNTKIRITIKKKDCRAKKAKMHHRKKKVTSKKITKKNKNSSPERKRI